MKFDDILQNYVGEFGPYQKKIYVLVCIPAVAAAVFSFLPTFIVATPNHSIVSVELRDGDAHLASASSADAERVQNFCGLRNRCRLPGLDNDTYSIQSEVHEQLIIASIPKEKDANGEMVLSKCHVYKSMANKTDMYVPGKEKETCNAWVYDESMTTAVTQYDMVCDYAVLQSHFKMISFIGALIGSFINGILSDMFGRKLLFFICLGIFLVATVAMVASPIYGLFLAMRFFQGVSGIGVFVISFVMVVELVGPSYRMFAGIVIELFWCLGLFILVGGAYFIRNWLYLVVAMTAPAVFFFPYVWILPESPRWLLSRGKVEQAEKILQRIAKGNGTELPETLLEEESEDEKKKKPKEAGQAWKLFTHRVLLIRMIILIFNRFALNMTYYGISLNVEHLSGSLYLNFTFSSIFETLGVCVIVLLINKFGRKPLYCGSMIVSAVGFLLTVLPIYLGTASDHVYVLALAMVGKFGTSAAYAIVYVYLSELVPTSLRNTAMGVSFCFEVLGGASSPYVINLANMLDAKTGKAFPMIMYGTVSLVAGLLSLLLPETKDKQLPETIDEAIKFGRTEVV